MDRAHRIGQTKPVSPDQPSFYVMLFSTDFLPSPFPFRRPPSFTLSFSPFAPHRPLPQVLVFRFETENSIDGLIIDRATRKRKLEQVVLGEGEFGAESELLRPRPADTFLFSQLFPRLSLFALTIPLHPHYPSSSLRSVSPLDLILSLLVGTFKGTDEDTSDVIAKAKGKGKTTKSKTDNAYQMEELAKRLLATEGQKITFAEGDQVLSDEQLEQLLDRSVSR